jgi:hypothetical protein
MEHGFFSWQVHSNISSFSPIVRVFDKRVTTTIRIVFVLIQRPHRVDLFTNFQDRNVGCSFSFNYWKKINFLQLKYRLFFKYKCELEHRNHYLIRHNGAERFSNIHNPCFSRWWAHNYTNKSGILRKQYSS